MSRAEISRLTPEQVLALCSRTMYTLDGLWFLAVEEQFGFEKAFEMDVAVWARLAGIEAKRVREAFGIDAENPLEVLTAVLELDPLLTVYRPEVVSLTADTAVVRFLDCPPQKARRRDGRLPLPCKELGMAMYRAYAAAVDPRIRMTCRACPPDEHPEEFWCEWQFEI
ncbi:MAG: DUF6125 family protein [Chloroflexota bacterium]